MARKKSFANGFTIDSLIDEPQNTSSGSTKMSGQGPVKGSGRGYGGAPTLNVIDYGEEMSRADSTAAGRVYPPNYGGVEPTITITKKSTKSRGQNGYKPSSGDLTAGPKS